MLDMLNELPGNTNLPTEESAVLYHLTDYFVATAATRTSSGSPEPRLELCCVLAVRLAL